MSVNRQDSNLIDFSPPSSGTSTPISRHSYAYPQSQSQPRSPPPQTSPNSGGSYIGSAVLGLWRRFSSLEAPTSPPSGTTTPPSHTALYNANSEPALPGDGINGPFIPPSRPPGRSASPRGLPSLEPLTLRGYRGDTGADERLLARGVAEEIRTFLPERLKIAEDWRLVYSLYQDGSSLGTLYKLCDEYRGRRVGFVLVVRDGKDGTFGAYLTEAPHPAASYYGTGECFLWRASLHAPLPPPPSADTTNINFRTTTIASPTASTASTFPPHDDRQPATQQQQTLAPGITDPSTNKLKPSSLPPPQPPAQSIRFQNFAYTGANDYCIFCESKFLSVGGGGGGTYGLWLNDGLSRGHSAPCDTFGNQPLSDEGEKFDVLGVELWVVGSG
ncbi:TLD-domain-containing protein [Hypoxylon trugodes]|uniref:TLD-domain-containing protein n=1 Tax=Hypoxylon trugodes TaxID=326681 RepID=UPI002199989A|nr:TLD-domain-containing protein [Hypoxylon trugodes]KAI1385238.1 TLD-domain-containing protein [Hypoxylon trugodes]